MIGDTFQVPVTVQTSSFDALKISVFTKASDDDDDDDAMEIVGMVQVDLKVPFAFFKKTVVKAVGITLLSPLLSDQASMAKPWVSSPKLVRAAA